MLHRTDAINLVGAANDFVGDIITESGGPLSEVNAFSTKIPGPPNKLMAFG
jgi:hypothetical protein